MARNPGLALSATVNGAGNAFIPVRPNGIYTWAVDQVSTEYPTAPTGAVSALRRNGALVTYLIATGDVADGSPPILLSSADVMTVEWSGAVPGAIVKALVMYDDGVTA